MEEQVKARLIGATVLVALVVLLVPEMLSGPKSGSDAAGVKGQRGTRTVTIDLGAVAGEAARLQPAVAADTTRSPPAATLPTVAPPGIAAEQRGDKSDSAPATPADGNAPSATESTPAKPAGVAAAATAKNTAVPAAGATNANPATTAAKGAPVAPTPAPSAQAAKPSTTAPVPPSSETVKGGWAVQVGAFGSSDAARKVVAELGQNGYHAYVAPLNRSGKTLYRVRVGPVAAKPDAEKLASRLKANGKSGTVVAAD